MGVAESRRGPQGKMLPLPKMDLDEIAARLRQVFQEQGVVLGYLFGSYVDGQPREASDLDIAVLLDPTVDCYSAYRDLLLAVREALHTERFDLVLLNSAPITLQFEVVSRGRLVYARSVEALNRYEMSILRRYQDTAYLRRVQDAYLREWARQWYSEKPRSESD